MGIDDVKEQLVDVEMSTPTAWLDAWPKSLVVGQLGQSLDGRIATPTGHSHYINAEASRAFLHLIRSQVDAVVIGVGTAVADQPRLDVRLIDGLSPARVVIDPSLRIDPDNRVLRDDGVRVMVCVDANRVDHNTRSNTLPAHVEVMPLEPTEAGKLCPHQIIQALRAVECQRILIEGGAQTISTFIQAQALDRLYLMVAPLIIGSGPAGIELPSIEHLDQAIRRSMRIASLGDELLVEFSF